MSDILMKVCGRLTEEQRGRILTNFYKLNPHWRGGHVEDIVDECDNSDAHCEQVDAAYEACPDLRIVGFGFAAQALILAGDELTEANLSKLLLPELT